MISRRRIYSNGNSEPYFILNNRRHFLKDIDITDNTCYTNAGYFGGFKVIGIDYAEPDERIILDVI